MALLLAASLYLGWLFGAVQGDSLPPIDLARFPNLPPGGPQPPPSYMVDNTHNYYGVAPDKGTLNGPVRTHDNLTAVIENSPDHTVNGTLLNSTYHASNATYRYTSNTTHSIYTRFSFEDVFESPHAPEISKRDSYWLSNLASLGNMPGAPSGYQFYRNVKTDFGAAGDGKTDDTMAINNAIAALNKQSMEAARCGQKCGSTTTLGAVVYFPAGTYLISSPIIQYYYTQFIGDATNRPTIKGTQNFTGIALMDTDVYIPGGNGSEWYINQNQFYRQIRNFVFDMTTMNPENTDNGQKYTPTGIHWQVAQATSLQNLYFNMPTSGDTPATAVGIFMENGSGGFLSDLEFYGGNIGFRAGSQQYTARDLKFTNCLTAVNMIWDWGFTWQRITVINNWVAFNVSSKGGSTNQGTGSISIIDSTFQHVPYCITTHTGGEAPDIVLDNLFIQNSAAVVLVSGGETIFPGSDGDLTIQSWAMGRRYTNPDGTGSYTTGLVRPAPVKPASLLDANGNYFVRSRPQYENIGAGGFVVATQNGISNTGTSDQTDAINNLLKANVGKPIFFPAGQYLVSNTVAVPVGSIIVGSAWSQIVGTGSYFQDMKNPKVMVRVGNPGDTGIIEISDMLFTVRGPTAGAILMEWNVHESTQGSAAMWDSHFRVGGSYNSELQLEDCPKLAGFFSKCVAASLLLHVTPQASGYFENVWAWVADHDIDAPVGGADTSSATQVSVYAGRGILIESQGPTWFYGTASEHCALYQYQLNKAKNIYMGHIQTETPYYQPSPNALLPFTPGTFPADPTFDDCSTGNCKEAWAVRIVDSSDVLVYSAGLYSFFNNYDQACVPNENCQERLMRVESSRRIWFFNIFTKGVVEIASPLGHVRPIFVNDSNQNGYTSEISVWLPLAGDDNGSNETVVYVDPTVWVEPDPTAKCTPPCIMVLPPSTLPSLTTITFPRYTTTLEVGWSTGGSYTATTVTTTLDIPPVTTSVISFWNYNVTTIQSGGSSLVIIPTMSISPPPFVITESVYPPGVTAPPEPRTIRPPPWPYSNSPPGTGPGGTGLPNGPTTTSSSTTIIPVIPIPPPAQTTHPTQTISWVTNFVPSPTTTTVNGKPEPVIPCFVWFIFKCPPNVGGFILFGWEIPGTYPPGPPPPIGPNPPPGVTLSIPWPEITIGNDLKPTYTAKPDPDDNPCETATESICTTTVSYGVARRATTAPSITTVQGIIPQDHPVFRKRATTTTKTVTNSFCTTVVGCTATGSSTTTSATNSPSASPYMIIPRDPHNAADIRTRISGLSSNFYESSSQWLGTIFFYVPSLSDTLRDFFQDDPDVEDIYVPKRIGNSIVIEDDGPQNTTDNQWQHLVKRAEISQDDALTQMVLLSWPPGSGPVPLKEGDMPGAYKYDDSAGRGTFLYSVDYGVIRTHTEISGLDISTIYTEPNRANNERGNDPKRHGTKCIAAMAGRTLGTARNAKIIQTVIEYQGAFFENFLDGLVKVHDDIRGKNGRGAKSVVNLSISIPTDHLEQAYINKMALVIRAILGTEAVFVTGSGNIVTRDPSPPYGYPALYGDPNNANYIPDLIVVGSVSIIGGVSYVGAAADWLTCYAPAQNIRVANPAAGDNEYVGASGTSYAGATVAGLAAYFRGISPDKLAMQRATRQEILDFAYKRQKYPNDPPTAPYQDKVVYNGQANGRSYVGQCEDLGGIQKRQADGSCPLNFPTNTLGGGNPITFSTGAPSPTCTYGPQCGTVCQGYYCSAPCSTNCGGPKSTQNPDFQDPRNPDSVQNPTGPNFGNWNGPGSGNSACNTITVTNCITTTGNTQCKTTEQCSTPPPTNTPTRVPPSTTQPSSTPPTVTATPNPTFAVYIDYAGGVNEDGGVTSQWIYFPKALDGKTLDVCTTTPAEVVFASPDIVQIRPGWPPDADVDVSSWGYKGCHYKGNDQGAGSMSCSGTGTFNCILDPQANEGGFDCYDILGIVTYLPRVRCLFPVI